MLDLYAVSVGSRASRSFASTRSAKIRESLFPDALRRAVAKMLAVIDAGSAAQLPGSSLVVA